MMKITLLCLVFIMKMLYSDAIKGGEYIIVKNIISKVVLNS